MQVGHPGCRDGLQQAEVHVGWERLEEGPSRAQQDGHPVEHGVLERRPYDRRPRYEYVLTDVGTELVDMLLVMVGWADKWLAGVQGRRSLTVTTRAARSATLTSAAHTAENRRMPATSS